MLSDGNENRLMVRCTVDRRQLIGASRKTIGHVGCELTVGSGRIQTLEESEFLGICRSCLVDGVQEFNNDMRVPLNLALGIEELRCGEVVLLCVHEEPSLHPPDGHLDLELGVLLDRVSILGEDELGGGHVIC